MKRSRILLIVLFVVLLATIGVILYLWHQDKQSWAIERANAATSLEAATSKWGSPVYCYTVKTGVRSGDLVNQNDLQQIEIPSIIDSSYYVKDPSNIVGKYYKIAISNPTILTNDMFIDDKVTDDMRSFDISLTSYSTGLKVGDYIDIYFTAPYGDRYLVLSKLKIRKISNSGLLTCYLTATQRHIYTGALIDYYLNSDYGATMTGERYIEPGMQQKAVEYYQVPENIQALLHYDPNVTADEISELDASQAQRESIERALAIFRTNEDTVESDAGKLKAGRDATTALINTETQAEAAMNNVDVGASELWDDASGAASDAASAASDAASGFTESSTPETESNMDGGDYSDTGTTDTGTADTGTADTGDTGDVAQ